MRSENIPTMVSPNAIFMKIFWSWVACHVFIWTVLPYLVQPNLSLDAVEMLYLGHEWPLGHFKHPTLPGWLAETASILTGNAEWAIYLLSQLAVGTCFWAAWRLGREVLSPRLAILGAALLEGCCYYNFNSTDFNNNLGMYPFWALAILFLYWAIRPNADHQNQHAWPANTVYWIAVGISLGLGMLAKYATGILVVTMLLYMILDPTARQWWRRAGPYWTIFSAMLVFSPNLYWILTSGFGPIEFAIRRTTIETSNTLTRFFYPAEFAGSQLLALLPLLVVALPLIRLRRTRDKTSLSENEYATGRFLHAMVMGPLIIHMLISVIGNLHLRSMYGSQLWTFFGIWLLYFLNIEERGSHYLKAYRKAVYGIILISLLFVLLFAGLAVWGPSVRHQISRTHFPGKALAAKVHEIWHETSDTPLPVVAGQWWPAANVGFYGPTRATVYGGSRSRSLDFAPQYSEWMNDQKFRKTGGVLVWVIPNTKDPSAMFEKEIGVLKERFPSLQILAPLELQPDTFGTVPPVRVGVGIIPPPQNPAE